MNQCSGEMQTFDVKVGSTYSPTRHYRLLAPKRASIPETDWGEFYFHNCIQRSNGVTAWCGI